MLPLGNGTGALSLRTPADAMAGYNRPPYVCICNIQIHTGKHSRLHADHPKARKQKATQFYTSKIFIPKCVSMVINPE